ncbi:MAG: hypothetical protein ACKN87_00250, partial [Microcystis aeruginosa]
TPKIFYSLTKIGNCASSCHKINIPLYIQAIVKTILQLAVTLDRYDITGGFHRRSTICATLIANVNDKINPIDHVK